MYSLIEQFCAPLSAYEPRMETDVLFPLAPAGHTFRGPLADAIGHITKRQLLDAALWRLFVDQFRIGNVDDGDKGWRCEYWGKMMRGGCFVYQATGDQALYGRLEAAARDMLTAQDGQGRFSTYSPEMEFDGWDIWGRKYILLGFQYFTEICRNGALKAEILTAMRRSADYIIARIGPADEGKKEINEATSHWKGLNSSSLLEPVVRLYSMTKDERYLAFAAYIVSRGGTSVTNIFELAYEDRLDPYQYPVTKAYEMMSCFEGLLEYWRITKIDWYRQAVLRFARRVYASDITVIGCAGCTHELFDHSTYRQYDETEKGIMQETCVTVTWMKLCFQLLCLTGDGIWAGHIEQSLFNALLGAVNTRDVTLNGGLPFDSYSPLLPGLRGRKIGGYKVMQNGAYYGCCACIGAAGLGLGGMYAVMCSRDGLVYNQYLPGVVRTVTPGGQPIAVRTDTMFPAGGTARLTVSLPREESFTVALLIPAWSEKTALSVNGKPVGVSAGQYAAVTRAWKSGDTILLAFDMRVRPIRPETYGAGPLPFLSLRRGPVVLARDARLGEKDITRPIRPHILADGSVLTVPADGAPYPAMLALRAVTDQGFIPMTDYASAGKTWAEDSKMSAIFRTDD